MSRGADSLSLLAGLARLVSRRSAALSPAGIEDAAALAALHASSFGRGWSAEEFERLLVEPSVLADRAMAGRRLAGFVLSRIAADQAEILSIAVADPFRRRGLAGKLLDVHLRGLSAAGVRLLFLEVDARNLAAQRLYARYGFVEVGRRNSYYAEAGRAAGAALVLRRDLV
jgi:ribosomal-protein-alanine N-acetyltransferase